jgi:hypothetical protein
MDCFASFGREVRLEVSAAPGLSHSVSAWRMCRATWLGGSRRHSVARIGPDGSKSLKALSTEACQTTVDAGVCHVGARSGPASALLKRAGAACALLRSAVRAGKSHPAARRARVRRPVACSAPWSGARREQAPVPRLECTRVGRAPEARRKVSSVHSAPAQPAVSAHREALRRSRRFAGAPMRGHAGSSPSHSRASDSVRALGATLVV